MFKYSINNTNDKNKEAQNSLFSFPLILLYGMSFFLPFERIFSFTINSITIRLTQILLLILLFFFFILLAFTKRKILFTSHHYILIAFFFINIISLSFAPLFIHSFKIFLFSAFTASLVFLLPFFVTKKKQLHKITKYILLSAILVSVFGIFQFIGDILGLPNTITGLREQYRQVILGFPRIQSTALEPLYFGNYLLFPFSIALTFLFTNKKYLPVVFLFLLNIILTGSRGAYAGTIIVCICIFFFKRKDILKTKILLSFLSIILLGGICAFLLLQTQNFPLQSRASQFITHISTLFDGAAFVERQETTMNALYLFTKKPFFGYGMGSFGPLHTNILHTQPHAGWAIVNNQVIEALFESGIFGLFFLALFLMNIFLSLYKCIQKTYSNLQIAIFSALAGICTQYLTFSTLYIFHIWFVIGLGITTMYLCKKHSF